MGFMHGIRTVHHRPLGYAGDADGVSTGRLDDATDRGLKSVPVRKLSQHLELPRCSVAPPPSLGMIGGQCGGLNSML
jgi:hypothetical protein